MRLVAIVAVAGALGCQPAAAHTDADASVDPPPVRVVVADPVGSSPAAVPVPDHPGGASLETIDLRVEDGALTEQLMVQAGRAVRAGKRPYVEMRANWCPICKRVDGALAQTDLAGELDDVVIIRVDTDRFSGELAGAGLKSPTIPAFYGLDRRGRVTDRFVNGHHWGPRADLPVHLRAYFSER